jgi:hypothetical protein
MTSEQPARRRSATSSGTHPWPGGVRAKGHVPVLAGSAAVAALVLGASVQEVRADDDAADAIPFEVATVFAELNDTDGDLGFHALIDGDAWKRLEIEAPGERRLLFVRVSGRLARQGLTELFFESAEPPFDELSPEEFFERFPEGEYEISGRTLDGEERESTAVFTHVLPAPTDNIEVSGEPTPTDCDAEDPPVVSDPVIISFDEVTASHPDLGASDPEIEIAGYQVVVEREEPTVLVFSVDLPPSETQVQVPPEFIALGTEFKLEVLAREAGGNQTAVETCFEVE